jgi:hypothetical protein
MRRLQVVVRVVACAALLAGAPAVARAALERVGPTNPANGFPAWYQDRSGLILDFCSPVDAAEYEGGWCLLLATPPPGNIPGGPPEVFPTNFSDEHFYFAADAVLPGPTDPPTAPKAKLVIGVEAAFATGPVIPGNQVTFGRIRVDMPAAPYCGTYYVYHPYGVMVVPDQVAGTRVFFTQDVGLACPAGVFDCALATGIGPFVVPSLTPGGSELPPVPVLDPVTGCGPVNGAVVCDPFFPALPTVNVSGFPGGARKYLSDPARSGPVTGSPVADFVSPADGLTYNANRFRIEVAPAGGGARVVLGDTTLFTVMGRIFEGAVPGRVTLDRASYARPVANTPNGSPNKLDVFATALPGVNGRVPPAPALPPAQPTLHFFDAPCGVDPAGAPTVPVDPVTGAALAPIPMNSAPGWKWVVGQTYPDPIPAAVCVEQTNAVDVNGNNVSMFAQAPVTDQVSISEALFNPNTGAFSVKASSSDQLAPAPALTVVGYGPICAAAPCPLANQVPGQLLVSPLLAPPSKVVVVSAAGGSNERLVKTAYFANPANNVPLAANDTFTVFEDCSATASNALCATPQVLDVLANDTVAGGPLPPTGAVVNITVPPLLGTAVVNANGTVSYRPNLNANGVDGFSYTDSLNGFLSNTGAVTVNVTPVNDAPVAVADSFVATVNPLTPTAVLLDVFANDLDPDGPGDLGAAVNLTPISAPAGAVWSVTGGAAGKVSFTATLSGTYTFSYQAQDKGGGVLPAVPLTSPPVVVTVNASGESVTMTRAQYTRTQLRWTVSGTYTPANATAARITLSYANGTKPGTVIGTAPNVNGAWTLDFKPATGDLDPRTTGATQLVATGPGGAKALLNISLK